MPTQVWLLFVIAALVMSGAPLLILVGGIAGHQLSPSESLKTLPIACFIVGAACATYPAVRAMGRFGRKKIFVLAAALLCVASLSIAAALQAVHFYLFCAATTLLGMGYACFQQLRFAAMELVPEALVGKAAARLMLSGLVAALLGPQLSQWGERLHTTPFVGGFILLALFGLVAIMLLSLFYREPSPPQVLHEDAGRPLAEIARNPVFMLAICSAAAAFAVMSLIMTATPLTMHVHNHFDLVRTKEVIQGHIFAMFFPAFFTGTLIQRWGESRVIAMGIGCFVLALVCALGGGALLNFWSALLLLGVGWNFMFVGATAALAKTYTQKEKFRVQSINDAVVFSCQALASLGAGWLLDLWGWQVLLLSCIPLLLPSTLALLWRKTPVVKAAC